MVGKPRFFRGWAQSITLAKIAPTATAAEMFNEYNTRFKQRLNDVFGDVKPESRYFDAYQKFMLNAARFAAAKSIMVQKLLTDAQSEPDTEKREWLRNNILEHYNGTYLEAELNAMLARCRTAKQWLDMHDPKRLRLFPNIKWLKSRSVVPYEPHKDFWGRVWSKDDAFWNDHQPGDHWNCKCDWHETADPVTDNAIIYKPSAARGLSGNPARSGEIFSDDASYFKNTKEKWKIGKMIMEQPDSAVFRNVQTADGKHYQEHIMVAAEQEAAKNRAITEMLLQEGYENIRLLPIIDRKEHELRERYYGKGYNYSKCPDATIDGKRAEFKECKGHYLNEHIEKAAQQAEIVVVSITGNMSDARIQSVIASKWTNIRCDKLERIIIFCGDKCFDVKRPK